VVTEDFEVDEMLFLAAVIENELEGMQAAKEFGALMPEMAEGVIEIGRKNVERAQAELDRLIEADKTWRPA